MYWINKEDFDLQPTSAICAECKADVKGLQSNFLEFLE